MADWIKMRCNLWTHPKVVTLASRLSVTRAHVIGALHGIWSVADQHADAAGRLEMTSDALDALAETPGLCEELAGVGWIEIGDGAVNFPEYAEHNGSTAKSRASGQKRQKKARDRDTPVTVDRDASVTRGEERRGEERREEKRLASAKRSSGSETTEPTLTPADGGGGKATDDGKAKPKKKPEDRSSEVRTVLEYYVGLHPQSKAAGLNSNSKEWKSIRARLNEGYDVEDLRSAIDGCHKTPYNCGNNRAGKKYLGLGLIVRDSSHVQQFMDNDLKPPKPDFVPPPQPTEEEASGQLL